MYHSFQSHGIVTWARNLFSPRDSSPGIACDGRNLSHGNQERRYKRAVLYICTDVRTHVCLPGASRTGCAAHFADETFFVTMRSVPRRGTRAFYNGVTRNGTRTYRAAKCIMLPGRRLQRASEAVYKNGAKARVGIPCSIELSHVHLSLSPILPPFLFLLPLSPHYVDAHE